MIARLETWWNVGVDSFAEDNGYAMAEVPRELIGYVTASVTDIKALEEAEGWAYDGGPTRLRVQDGRVHMALAWRLEVNRGAWAAVRGLDPRAGLRRDFAEHIARKLISLPSVCETDAVMTARFASGNGPIWRTWTWQDRHHHEAHDDGPSVHLPVAPFRPGPQEGTEMTATAWRSSIRQYENGDKVRRVGGPKGSGGTVYSSNPMVGAQEGRKVYTVLREGGVFSALDYRLEPDV